MGEVKKQKHNGKGKEEVVTAKGGEDNINHESKSRVITDTRFSSVHSDPRFQRVPKKQSKVSIDSRFNRMFSDKQFSSSSAPIDKRGKPKKETSESHLRHYYRLEDEEQQEENQQKPKKEKMEKKEKESEKKSDLGKVGHGDSSSESSRESESESESSKSSSAESESDTSNSTSDTDDDEVEAYSEDDVSIQEETIPEIEKETHRLAVVNMDWSQVKAVDLFVVLSSFLPKGGQILSVAVYPSEFGLKRMEEEAVRGPVDLFDSDKERSDDDEDDEIDDEKLRAYEKSRLRYYYAVVECDSSATADYLYKACDGVEFERSSNVLDLRFIPDSLEFKHPPREIVTEPPTNYEGLDFHSRALQHSKIHLTWDDDEPQRAKTLKRKFNVDQLADLELKEFLASDDGESEDDDDDNDEAFDGQFDKKLDKREKYRALIQSGDGSDGEEEEKDMEITFNTGLEDVSKRILEKKDKKSETVWETYLRKRSEKKKARKKNTKYSSEDDSSDTDREVPEQPDDFFIEEPSLRNSKKEKQQQGTDKEQEASRAELELLLADDHLGDQSLKGYNLKLKKAKGKKGKEIPMADKLPSTDYDDPRFSSLFTSPLFALDPTDPHFKRSAAYARQMAQKQRTGVQVDVSGRRQMESGREAQLPSNDLASTKDDQSLSSNVPSEKKKHELSSLVRSIKKKAQQVQLPNNILAPKKYEPLLSDGKSRKKEKHRLSAAVDSVKKKART
ncbi:pre-rRNA-processing protein ESF1-like [Telopea speciosissima]|uniref:pre-rRNA-processing protein ESF1-like n=1 Tax=Telopea speciosissima TaxID=54955 RepID=UPI001CC3E75B|nr:pre-rRNA-processing protein ESF1-like [Telopea speciosissima]